MSAERTPQKVFSDPETQALHERNLEWLRLMEEDPGWALSRLHRLSELEEQLEAALEMFRKIAEAAGEDGVSPEEWRAMVRPSPGGLALEAVVQLRNDYDDCLQEIASYPASRRDG